MTKNALNHDIGNAEFVQVRSESATESVQAVPRDASFLKSGTNHLIHNAIEVSRVTTESLEYVCRRFRRRKMLVEDRCRRRDQRNDTSAPLALRLSDVSTPSSTTDR